MTAKSFVTLAIATVVTLLLAILTSAYSGLGDGIEERGEALVPNLIDKANAIARIEVDVGDAPIVMVRKGGKLQDEQGFPARASIARELISSIALMTIVERKTDDKERLSELDLAKPGAKGGGDRVVFKSASGNVIADVVIGARDYTVGGVRGGQFARRGGSNQAYLVRGSATPPVSRTGWFDNAIAEIQGKSIARITALQGDTPRFAMTGQDGTFALDRVPADRTADADKLSKLARAFDPLRFSDVRAVPKDAKPPAGPRMSVVTTDGLTLTIARVAPVKDVQGTVPGWTRIAATGTTEASKAAAETINTVASGFEFKLAKDQAELLRSTTETLLAAATPAANGSPSPPAQ